MITLDRKLMLTFSLLNMWEKFGYYGMRALLTLFLIKHYGFSDIKAFSIYSLYSALCYIVPVLAGFLADKIFGYKKLLFFGAILICIGHATLSFGLSHEWMFYLGLTFVAIGTGFFKGNVTNMLGSTYGDKNSKERDDGFRIFYIMPNFGTFISSIICGIVAEIYGWDYGFGLAGLGMALGLITLISARKLLMHYGNPPTSQPAFAYLKSSSLKVIASILLVGISVMAFVYIDISLKAISISGIFVVLHLAYIMSRCEQKERTGLFFICIMLFFFTLMFALEMQLGSIINIFTDRHVDSKILGITIPAASLQALNPLAIILLGAFANMALKKLGQHNTLKVFGAGLAMSFLSMLTLYVGCIYYDSNIKINVLFLVTSMIFISLSELMMAPIMQALITYIPPKKIRGYMMGFLLLCLSYSNLAGVLIAKYMLQIDTKDTHVGSLKSLITYQDCFLKIGMLFVVASIIYVALYRSLNREYTSYN
jgi:POT family proton-dependent oligopeptide transporter